MEGTQLLNRTIYDLLCCVLSVEIRSQRMIVRQESIQGQCISPDGVINVAGIFADWSRYFTKAAIPGVPFPPFPDRDPLLHEAFVRCEVLHIHCEFELFFLKVS